MRILIAEGNSDLGQALFTRLRREGHAVDWLVEGDAADDVLAYQAYDLIVLDVDLPGMDGISVLRALRRRGARTPVMMLTSGSRLQDRVDMLDIGADDMLAQPFDYLEFDARCRALLRRSQGFVTNVLTAGSLRIDCKSRRVWIGDRPTSLPNREFRLLEIMIGSFGNVVSKEEIARRLFDFDDDAGINAIEIYVGRLRRKLAGAVTFRTLHGFGYAAEPHRDERKTPWPAASTRAQLEISVATSPT